MAEQMTKLTAAEAEQQFPGSGDFVHLHNHTLFSILDGVAQPDEYFKSCVDRKSPAIAITEHGVLNSIPDNYLAAKEHKVKYLVGCEIYFNDFEMKRQKLLSAGVAMPEIKQSNPDLAARMSRNRHLTVIAKNINGYQNLLKINKAAWEKGFYYRPRAWFDLLAQHKDDLIILSGCFNGPISHELRQGNYSSSGFVIGAIDYVNKFQQVFGDDFYIELQMPGVEGDVELFRQLADIACHKKIKTVLTNDCHYLERKDYEVQRVMMAIDQDTTVDDPELFAVNSSEQYFKTRYELRATFHLNGFAPVSSTDLFEASCDNTLEVAEKCESFKPDLSPKLPKIENAEEQLIRLTLQGLRKKGLDKDTTKYHVDGRDVTYKEQMQIEIDRIIEKGFASYFLITRSLVQCSLEKGWPLGPGRGSAAGSLVCYLLDISQLDPIKWKLSFDRFLSPARGGYMLDIKMSSKEQPKK
jgi:DNA polymerase-3 subunit alpha